MSTIEVTLQKGLRVGQISHTIAVLREPSAGDVIDASMDAEKVVMVPTGVDGAGHAVMEPQLVTSPTLVGINVLRRQIVRIGAIDGPLERELLDKLSPTDLNLLQAKAQELEAASIEVAQRGRADHAGEDSPQGD